MNDNGLTVPSGHTDETMNMSNSPSTSESSSAAAAAPPPEQRPPQDRLNHHHHDYRRYAPDEESMPLEEGHSLDLVARTPALSVAEPSMDFMELHQGEQSVTSSTSQEEVIHLTDPPPPPPALKEQAQPQHNSHRTRHSQTQSTTTANSRRIDDSSSSSSMRQKAASMNTAVSFESSQHSHTTTTSTTRQRRPGIHTRRGSILMDQPSDKDEQKSLSKNQSNRTRYDEGIKNKKMDEIKAKRQSSIGVSIEAQEIAIRSLPEGGCRESLDSVISSLKVIFVFMLSKETYFTITLSMLSTCYFYFMNKDDDEWDGGGIPFVLLGVAVVIPTINLITMEYTRRETALQRLSELKGTWIRLYCLHAFMDWNNGQGRASQDPDDPYYLGIEHSDDVADNILGACDELMRFLTLPSATNTSNLLTTGGQIRASHILSVAEPLFESATARRAARFTKLAERLKAAGASQTEMSRVEQFTKDMQAQYEHLRFLKIYRTPQALRSLARITTLAMLPLFGPSFAHLALNIGSLFLGLMLTAVSALILSGLYEAARVVEDPFTAFIVMDGINVREELDTVFRQIISIREEAFGAEARLKIYDLPPSHCLTSPNLIDPETGEAPAEGFGERGTTVRNVVHDMDMDHILNSSFSKKSRNHLGRRN